jgi:hypothetical protein
MSKRDQKAYLKEYYQLHKNELDEKNRQWRLTHPDEHKEHCRKYSQKHKEKIKETGNIWRASNSTRTEQLDMKYKMAARGITIDDYENMLLRQDGRCAICGRDVCELSERLCVDHDHKSGRVRGLLCRPCNLILGNAREDIEVLAGAKIYLERTMSNG